MRVTDALPTGSFKHRPAYPVFQRHPYSAAVCFPFAGFIPDCSTRVTGRQMCKPFTIKGTCLGTVPPGGDAGTDGSQRGFRSSLASTRSFQSALVHRLVVDSTPVRNQLGREEENICWTPNRFWQSPTDTARVHFPFGVTYPLSHGKRTATSERGECSHQCL